MSAPPGRVFFSQRVLDRILDQGRGRLDENRLTLTDKKHPAYLLKTAHRVLRVIGGMEDAYRLVGKVLSEEQIQEVGGNLYMGSLVVGDVPYEIESGHMGDPLSTPPDSEDDRWADDILRVLE